MLYRRHLLTFSSQSVRECSLFVDLVYCVGQLSHVQSFLHFMNKFGLFYMLLNLDCYYFVQDFVVIAFYGYWYVVVLFCVVLAWFCHWDNMILEGVSGCYIINIASIMG